MSLEAQLQGWQDRAANYEDEIVKLHAERDALQKALDEMTKQRDNYRESMGNLATLNIETIEKLDESRALVAEMQAVMREWPEIQKGRADLASYRAKVERELKSGMLDKCPHCGQKVILNQVCVGCDSGFDAPKALAAEGPKCVCGDKTSQGVIHRTDGPCYQEGPREVPK